MSLTHLEMIKKAVNAQTMDAGIWVVPLLEPQSKTEVYLQESLKDLHSVILDQDEAALKRIMERAFD